MKNRNQYGKSLLWLVPLAAQLAFLTVLTFARHVQFVDSDAAKLYAHAAAIWDAKTLFVPDWQYITTMELDCGLLFALPFYGLTHNIVTAFACSDVVLYLLWAAVCFALARRLLPDAPQKALEAGAVGSLLLLTPYTVDVLYYGNMLFLGGAQYVVKAMLPLLLIWLLLAPDPARPTRRAWAVLAVYLAGTLLTALSSGIYVAAMGFAPVLLLFALGWLQQDERLTPYTAAVTFGSVAATLAGMLWARAADIEIKGGKMVLAAADTLADNVRNCFVGIFRLMGAAAGEADVTELSGLTQLLCYALGALLLLTAAGAPVRLFRNKRDPQARREGYFAVPALWNLALLSILDTRYGDAYFEVRYHLVWIVPLFVLFAVRAVRCINAEPPRMRRTLKTALAVFVCLLALLCDRRGWNACSPDTEGTSEIGRVQQLCAYLSTQAPQDTDEVYVVLASYAAEMGEVLDENHTYRTLGFSEGAWQLVTYDGSTASLDARPEHKPALLVVREDTAMSDLPIYLQQAEFVAQVNVFGVYRLPDGSVLDGVVGLPYRGGPGIDYPDSVGYDHEGQPEADRSLTTDPAGGRVLKSPALTLSAVADITVNWNPIEGQNAAGRVVLYQGDAELAALPLAGTAVTLENLPAGSDYRLNVETEGGSIKINSIAFTPK